MSTAKVEGPMLRQILEQTPRDKRPERCGWLCNLNPNATLRRCEQAAAPGKRFCPRHELENQIAMLTNREPL